MAERAARKGTKGAKGAGKKKTQRRRRTAKPKLAEKLLAASKAVATVERNGTVEMKKGDRKIPLYDYVLAEDVIKAANAALHAEDLLVRFAVSGPPEQLPAGRGLVVSVEGEVIVTEPTTGEEIRQPALGAGWDDIGDKAIHKAMTGARKYALIHLLGIPIGEDPEDDQGAEERGPVQTNLGGESVAKLLDGIKEIGADADAKLKRELKLKLGSMGVEVDEGSINRTLARLNPNQALELDGWISEKGSEKKKGKKS